MQMAIIIAAILLFAVLLWLFSIAPQILGRPDLSALKKYDYAHRGLHNIKKGIPENSMKAFEYAVKCRFGMEFDLQLTKDNKVVVHHDHSILRSCGEDILISDVTYEQLQEYYLFGTEQKIPLFSDVLKTVSGVVPLIIELKNYNDTNTLCSLAWEILKDYTGIYCIESFDPQIVRWFKRNHPEVIRGQLMERLKKGENGLNAVTAFLGRNMFTNFYTRPNFEAYDFKRRNNLSLRTARALFSMQEVSWTLRTEKDFNTAKANGCICIFENINPESVSKEEQIDFVNRRLGIVNGKPASGISNVKAIKPENKV